MAKYSFNAAEVETNDFMAIPAGWYAAEITESEMKDTKSGNGQYLQLTIKLIDGEHSGRLLFERLNLINPNETAVSIAQQTLANICESVNMKGFDDSIELHGKPFMVSVKVIKDDAYGDANGEKNEIGGYKPAGNLPTSAPKAEKKAATDRPW